MANGIIRQYKGPFPIGYQIPIEGMCRIGISIDEDDFMKLGSGTQEKSFNFTINSKSIWMGRTDMYETMEEIENPIIVFPEGAPLSTIVNVVY